jgi:hypothetical protein
MSQFDGNTEPCQRCLVTTKAKFHTFSMLLAAMWPLLPSQDVVIQRHGKDNFMKLRVLISAAIVAIVAVPVAAQAQGIPGGVAHGAYEGNRRAGPIGAVVGAAVGGVIGGIEGVLGVDRAYYEPTYTPPVRTLRHRRVVRAHVKHPRRARHSRSSEG